MKVTVERPLRMRFEATPERIALLEDQTAFANLVKSKKKKDVVAANTEIAKGRKLQEQIRALLTTLEANGRYMDRAAFEVDLEKAAKKSGIKIPAPIKKAVYGALGERDVDAEICRDSKDRPEPDSQLRDAENVPLPFDFPVPANFTESLRKDTNSEHRNARLPMLFGPDKSNDCLLEAMSASIDSFMAKEVLPHVPDAWVDYSKTKVGYEIPINRHFYSYQPPRSIGDIELDISAIEGEIAELLRGLVK